MHLEDIESLHNKIKLNYCRNIGVNFTDPAAMSLPQVCFVKYFIKRNIFIMTIFNTL
jgi:hypothetical protein